LDRPFSFEAMLAKIVTTGLHLFLAHPLSRFSAALPALSAIFLCPAA
jgi:hypothetical protein